MLEVKNLSYRYPEADIDADFQVPTGRSIVLMGPSGCGKTTILNLIAGLLKPSGGEIRFKGQSLLPLKPAERPVTFLFQAHNLFPHLTVWQNLALGIDPGLKVSAEDQQNIASALDWISMPEFARRHPDELSGGQQQRVALARCLLRNRPLLLLDEPFSALDQSLRSDMIKLILQLQQKQSLTLVIATHQSQDAEALGAQIEILG
ncbi:MAG: ATP-binding cassette domain-containing protein [bacterium]